MKIYVSNLVVGLEQGLDRPEFLLDTAEPFNNAVGIEFFIHTYSERYMDKLKHVREWTGKLPLAFHGPFKTVEATSSPGTEEYSWFEDSYIRALQIVRAFGGKHIVFHDHERFVRPEEKAALQRRCLENMRTLEQKAMSFGVRLFLENLALPIKGTPIFDQDEYMELFERFPSSGCLIDVGHLAVAGWDMEKVIYTLRGRIEAYHLHNNDGKADRHCRIGKGVISYEEFFRLYRRYTPKADLTLEYGDGQGITVGQIKEDLGYVLEQAKTAAG